MNSVEQTETEIEGRMVHGAPGAWVEQGLQSTRSFLRLVQSDIDAAVASLREVSEEELSV